MVAGIDAWGVAVAIKGRFSNVLNLKPISYALQRDNTVKFETNIPRKGIARPQF